VLTSITSGVNLSVHQAIGTIVDNHVCAVSINDVGVSEIPGGSINAVFTVTLSSSNSQPVTVNFATVDNTAIAPGDYASTNGTLTFPPGVTTLFVSVVVFGDVQSKDLPVETFYVNLTNPVNATCGRCQGVCYITNVD